METIVYNRDPNTALLGVRLLRLAGWLLWLSSLCLLFFLCLGVARTEHGIILVLYCC